MSTTWTGEPRETRRLSKAEIEHSLLETAKKLIAENGLTVSLEHLRLDELMELAGVPKTSFYRVWESKESFFARLLEELVQPEGQVGAAYDPETLAVAHRVVRENAHMLETAEGRRQLLGETIRQGAEQNFKALLVSREWQTYMAILATLPGIADQESRERILGSLQTAESFFIEQMASFYAELLPVFRYRLRPGVTTQHLAAVGAAVVEGLVQRDVVNPIIVEAAIPGPAIDGGEAQWHLAAIGFLGVTLALIEPDDTTRE